MFSEFVSSIMRKYILYKFKRVQRQPQRPCAKGVNLNLQVEGMMMESAKSIVKEVICTAYAKD